MRNALKLFSRYSKYRAVPTEIDGIRFASKAEAALYQYLKLAGEVPIKTQPKVYLTKAKILFKPDFFSGGVYFEMKGMETASYKIKARLWRHYGPAPLHVYELKSNKVCHKETINPVEPCDE